MKQESREKSTNVSRKWLTVKRTWRFSSPSRATIRKHQACKSCNTTMWRRHCRSLHSNKTSSPYNHHRWSQDRPRSVFYLLFRSSNRSPHAIQIWNSDEQRKALHCCPRGLCRRLLIFNVTELVSMPSSLLTYNWNCIFCEKSMTFGWPWILCSRHELLVSWDKWQLIFLDTGIIWRKLSTQEHLPARQ